MTKKRKKIEAEDEAIKVWNRREEDG